MSTTAVELIAAADSAAITAVMRDVLRQEADAVLAMAAGLDAAWVAAVGVLAAVRASGGRVVISGVGKSGHVGAKMAATFASTGTPAQFIHATEAAHGDLGMIGPRDVLLLLSTSGATTELLPVAGFARREGLPVLLISRDAKPALASYASHVLRLPAVPEACPNGQAPMTSSTAMMAAGDALAVALMRLAGFTAEDFRRIHPGGALGASVAAADRG